MLRKHIGMVREGRTACLSKLSKTRSVKKKPSLTHAAAFRSYRILAFLKISSPYSFTEAFSVSLVTPGVPEVIWPHNLTTFS